MEEPENNGSQNPDQSDLELIKVSRKEGKFNEKVRIVVYTNGLAMFNSIYLLGAKIMQQQAIRFLDIVFIRYFIAIIISYAVYKLSGRNIFSEKTTWGERRDLLLRTILGLLDFCCFVFSSNFLPLSLLSLIQSTMGFWAAIIGYFTFGDHLHWQEVAGMIIGYFGIFLIILSHPEDNGEGKSKQNLPLGFSFALLSTLFASLICVILRKMRNLHFTFVHFSYSTMGTTVLGIVWIITYIQEANSLITIKYSSTEYAELVLFSSSNAIGMLFGTLAYQVEKAGAVSIIQYVQVLYGLLVDIILFKYHFTLLQFCGGSIVLFTNIYIGFMKLRNKL